LGLAEALKRADKAGDLSGKAILKTGFETMKNYEIGLGIAPVTYTATDHRSMSEAKIYEYKNGKFNPLAGVDLKELWPDKWNKDWLGW
jgi:branched-chain amino acid transport system substrate-binding protein